MLKTLENFLQCSFPLQLTPLPKFGDTHHLAEEYHISVYTSWKTQRRFTGTVSLQLFGSKGESNPIILDDGERLVKVFSSLN